MKFDRAAGLSVIAICNVQFIIIITIFVIFNFFFLIFQLGAVIIFAKWNKIKILTLLSRFLKFLFYKKDTMLFFHVNYQRQLYVVIVYFKK